MDKMNLCGINTSSNALMVGVPVGLTKVVFKAP